MRRFCKKRTRQTCASGSTGTCESYRAERHAGVPLPHLAGRASALLKAGAKLTFDRELPKVGGATFEVWAPGESVDQGLHRRTTYHRDFGWDPMFCRTPWANGPDYMQWTIPAGFYLNAYVLCADIPETHKVPGVGSCLTRFGASNQDSFAFAFTDLSGAATNRNVRQVGRLDCVFHDGKGKEVAKHAAAFTLLGRNDREAGFESPYACWPQGTGYDRNRDGEWGFWSLGRSNSNPNRMEVAELMHKAGYHSAWGPPVKDEKELPEYQITLSAFSKFCNGIYWPSDLKYKEISNVMLTNAPAARGKYRGIDGHFLVYWSTELAKRMRKEFPDCHLQIASDMIGMLWALRETAARFGYTNKLLNACTEYVFRPERPYHVSADKTRRERMQVTDFTLRDYLISLAHGCWTISTGQLEDCNTQYYDTNWGAGGQCKFYPYSYPKRMFTGIATLTRVMDKVRFSRVLDTGANSVYAIEFTRDRKIKDFAYAFWTPMYESEITANTGSGSGSSKARTPGRAISDAPCSRSRTCGFRTIPRSIRRRTRWRTARRRHTPPRRVSSRRRITTRTSR